MRGLYSPLFLAILSTVQDPSIKVVVVLLEFHCYLFLLKKPHFQIIAENLAVFFDFNRKNIFR